MMPPEPDRGFLVLPPGETPDPGRFPPLTFTEQASLDRVKAIARRETADTSLVLVRIEHEGRPRAVIAAYTQAPSGETIMQPIALLLDDDLFLGVEPPPNRVSVDLGRALSRYVKPTVVHDLLTLVEAEFPGPMPSVDWIEVHWDADTRREVVEWASAVHLAASDNEGVEVPPMPEVLNNS